jgi:predicted Zn-dependent peptidase
LRLFSVLAGETASSRLFQAVREDRGWAYSVSSQVHLFDETGCFGVEAGLETSRAAAALRLIGRELRRLATRGPEEAELRRARDYAIGQLRLGLESASSRLGWVGEQTLCYDRVLEPERVVAALQRVSLDEVRSVAAQVLRAARASVALVVPHEHQKEFAGAASMLASVG